MIEEKYNTKDIRHIDEKSQKYIAEGNRMTKEIINSDGSRNWEANILLDNIKRLEQENFALTQESRQKSQTICELEQENKELKEENIEYDEELAIEKLSHKSDLETLEQYRSALEEIKNLVKEISYLGSRGERELKFKIKNILEDVIDEEIY